MDNRAYKTKTYDGGFTADETIRFNPRTLSVEKISDNEVVWEFDNCTVTVTADGTGNKRENIKCKVVMKDV